MSLGDRTRRPVLAVLLTSCVVVGCAPKSSQAAATQATVQESQPQQASLTLSYPTWDMIQAAPWTTTYQGVRSVEFTVVGPEGPQMVRYKERVSCDGSGSYSIEPLQAETLVYPDEPTFLLLQEQRQGFFYRYRDFAVRDARIMLENFQLLSVDVVTIAGRTCREVELLRKIPGGHHYQVAFDVETGIPLRYVEFDDEVQPVAQMEYESVDFAPSLNGVAYHLPANREVLLDMNEALGTLRVLGFTPRSPAFVPEGFELMETTKVEEPNGRRWVKWTYTDGVETLFFLHRTDQPGDPVPRQNEPARMLVYDAGPAMIVQGSVGVHEFIAVGEVSETALLTMVDSALD